MPTFNFNNMDQNQNPIESISLLAFIQQQGFTQLATKKVRRNENKYPFLTFINAENEATNVYFSKNESEKLKDVEEVDDEYLMKLQVVNTENAEGEKRWKLTTGNSERVDLLDLLKDAA